MTTIVAYMDPRGAAGAEQWGHGAEGREFPAGRLEDTEMDGTSNVRMLGAITERPAAKPADTETEPIEPGARVDGARGSTPPAQPGTSPARRDTRVAPGRFELNAALHPRGLGRRWRP